MKVVNNRLPILPVGSYVVPFCVVLGQSNDVMTNYDLTKTLIQERFNEILDQR